MTSRIQKFGFKDISNTWDIRTYCFKYSELWILGQMPQYQKRKKIEPFLEIFELYQVARYSQKTSSDKILSNCIH